MASTASKITFRFLKFIFREKISIGKNIFFHHKKKNKIFSSRWKKWDFGRFFFRGDEKTHNNGEGIRYIMMKERYSGSNQKWSLEMLFTVPVIWSTFAKVNERDEMRRAIKKDFIAHTIIQMSDFSNYLFQKTIAY